MKNIKHPAFLLGIAAFILIIISAGIKSEGYGLGRYLIIGAGIMALASWVWSIIDVATRTDMKPFQKRFWLIAVVAVPTIGGLIFHILHQKANRLTT